ncbi:MAG: MSHA pilin protein MshA [Moritella dasanensis]
MIDWLITVCQRVFDELTFKGYFSNESEMKSNNGFTLIELVIVIIVLGILSATAVPKFINLKSDAKKSTLDGFSGAISSTDSMVMSKAAIDGIGNTDKPVKLNGSDVTVEGGHLTLTIENISNAMQVSGFNLIEYTRGYGDKNILVTLGKEKDFTDVRASNCFLFITSSLVRMENNSEGVQVNTVIPTDFDVIKLYDGC